MHIVIATLYSIIWLPLLSYTIIVGGFWIVALVAGPFIISASARSQNCSGIAVWRPQSGTCTGS